MSQQLLKLLALNKSRGQFRAEQTDEEATIYLYDYITSDDYWGGVGAQTFAKELANIAAPVIHLRINSPGGDVFAARAMEQSIREHGSKVIAHIDGYAASAASYLALAADEVIIGQGAFFMIHKAWTFAYGNADELTKTANLLTKIDGSLAKTYAAETGQDEQQIIDWMAAETWFTADESVQYGFADSIAQDADNASASNHINWDLSAYAKAPTALDTQPSPAKNTTPEPDQHPKPADLSNHFRLLALVERAAA